MTDTFLDYYVLLKKMNYLFQKYFGIKLILLVVAMEILSFQHQLVDILVRLFYQTLQIYMVQEIPASRVFLGANAQLLGTSLAGGNEYRDLWPLIAINAKND